MGKIELVELTTKSMKELIIKDSKYKGRVNDTLRIKDTLHCFPNSSIWTSSRHPKVSMTMTGAVSCPPNTY